MSKVTVPPNPHYIAEVVVLLTSLGAKRSELNAGRRACDILETKRAHRKVIDFNLDARAGRQSGEEEAIERLEARHEAVKNEDGELPLPQIYVDGSYLGDTVALQGLEDDGLLGRILRRQLCLKCHRLKAPDSMTCLLCGAEFEEILPQQMTIEDALRQHYGHYGKAELEEEDPDSGSEAGERFEAYATESAAPAKPAKPSAPAAVPKKRMSATALQKKVIPKGRGTTMFEERKLLLGPSSESGVEETVPSTAAPTACAASARAPQAVASPSEPKADNARVPPPAAANLNKAGAPRSEPKANNAQLPPPAAANLHEASHFTESTVDNTRQPPAIAPDPPKEAARRAAPPAPVPAPVAPEKQLPVLKGYLWKKSPNQLRLRSFEQRYFVVREMQVCWWKTMQDACAENNQGGGALCKGFIDLSAGPVEVKLMLGNESTFLLTPVGGTWAPGAIRKGDPGRAYTFDATDSPHDCDTWVRVIHQHIQRAKAKTAPRHTALQGAHVEPGPSFYAAVGLPPAAKGGQLKAF